MSVIIYTCDTCKREIEKTQNPEGLEIIGRCIITDNCKGFLYRTGSKPQAVARTSPAPVQGLTDWRQRKKIFTHNQETAANVWTVEHKLDTHPSVQTFIYQVVSPTERNLVEVTPTATRYINGDTVELEFESSVTGIAQTIARSATTNQPIEFKDQSTDTSALTLNQMTNSLFLTLATLDDSTDLDLTPTFLSTTDLTPIPGIADVTFGATVPNSLWFPIDKVLINGKLYTVRVGSFDANVLNTLGVRNGSSLFFTLPGGGSIAEDSIYVLNTTEPYTSVVDRDFDNVVDLSKVTNANVGSSFVFNDGEIQYNVNLKQRVYPPILIPQ
jgi:hypothetical protein